MYHFIEDKIFERKLRNYCGNIMQSLCHKLKENYSISSSFYLVGSGARNLITQNEDENIDLDYNLEIIKCDGINMNDCRKLKNVIIKCFNEFFDECGWSNCEDSTSSITTEKRYFAKGNKTNFSIDICITHKGNDNNYYRLIHRKTGWVQFDSYVWEIAPNSKNLKK